jgi:hypothetical protein
VWPAGVHKVVTHVRVACPDDPAARPLLDGLAAEYARMYGEKTDGEQSVREVEEFLRRAASSCLYSAARRPSREAASRRSAATPPRCRT